MPPLQEIDPNVSTPAKRCGPKRKAYIDRQFTPRPPIQRIERTYSKAKKEEIIIWMTRHRIERNGEWKQPSFRDAEAHWKVPFKTISNWWKLRDTLVPSRQTRQYSPYWPDLEKELYVMFLEARGRHKVVTTSWFRHKARSIFARLPPASQHRKALSHKASHKATRGLY
ncbi:hypothetical protein BKA56DRAFT_195299 [Ilyonectria sp. MPI-CAGE-AT-0026]|nr:hypothetical protein BKA56DRAFT_195299 [Ilyonectria sp. MPI-CAGE-AT-0026]